MAWESFLSKVSDEIRLHDNILPIIIRIVSFCAEKRKAPLFYVKREIIKEDKKGG